jgi:hypothetical protein
MQLEIDSGIVAGPVDAAAFEQTLDRLAWDSDVTFAILTAIGGDFIQTAARERGFLLERRTSSPEHHFRALRTDVSAAEPKKRPWWSIFGRTEDPRRLFSREEVGAAFAGFAAGSPDPAFLEWENIDAEMGLARQ